MHAPARRSPHQLVSDNPTTYNFFASLPPSLSLSRSERATRGRKIHGSCVGIRTLSATDGPLKLHSCDFSGGVRGVPPRNDTRVLYLLGVSTKLNMTPRWASRAAASSTTITRFYHSLCFLLTACRCPPAAIATATAVIDPSTSKPIGHGRRMSNNSNRTKQHLTHCIVTPIIS